jgi:hypothetical protein
MQRIFSYFRIRPSHLAGWLAVIAFLLPAALSAQTIDLEGQTGGYLVPTAYSIPSDIGKKWSEPTISFHYLQAGKVIGDFYISSVTEGYRNWLEFGYTRNSHSNGSDQFLGNLWQYSGFNVFNAKARVIKEEWRGKKWIPAVSVGSVVRTNDYFVTGALVPGAKGPTPQTNADIYVVGTKLVKQTKIPLLLTAGFRVTNAQLYGAGGNAGSKPVCTLTGCTNGNTWSPRGFGSLGIPIPLSKSATAIVVVPGAEITQEPRYVQYLPQAHIPTTEVYGLRITRLPNFRWTLDGGVGHVGNMVTPQYGIHANTVESLALTYRFK